MRIIEPSFSIMGQYDGDEILKRIERYGRVIVLEDDLIVTEDFLSFMNEREHEWYFFRENLAPIYQLDFDFTVEGSLMEFHTFAKRNPYFILATVDKRGLHILEIISNKDFLYYPDFWKNINNMTDTKIKWNKDFPLSKD